jgi:hypothetical protein
VLVEFGRDDIYLFSVLGYHKLSYPRSRVIAFNRFVRAQEPGWFFDDIPWPDEYLVIGNEYDQNYYLVNRLSGDETVYRWSHEDGQLQTVAGSLPEFRDNMCVWFEEWKREFERDNAEQKRCT